MRRKRKHNKKERMYPIVKEWLSTGERKIDLCQRHGITVDVFSYWLGKYRREQGSVPGDSSQFIPIKLKTAPSFGLNEQEKIEIHYSDGTQILLPVNLPMTQIRLLLPSFGDTHV